MPWDALDSILGRSQPKQRSPWDALDGILGSGSDDGVGGEWESVSPILQRRRKADGGYEYRPTPHDYAPGTNDSLTVDDSSRGLGSVDVSDKPREDFWSLPSRSSQSPTEAFVNDTIADRGFGWAVGGLERIGVIPEGTRAALRENQQESTERYMVAHPEGGLLRAIGLAGGDIAASMAGPQLALGPGLGALGAKGATALGAAPGLARAAGIGAGALEGAGQGYLDSPDLTPEERYKQIALGGVLGGLGSARGVPKPEPFPQPSPRPRITPEIAELQGRSLQIAAKGIPPTPLSGLDGPDLSDITVGAEQLPLNLDGAITTHRLLGTDYDNLPDSVQQIARSRRAWANTPDTPPRQLEKGQWIREEQVHPVNPLVVTANKIELAERVDPKLIRDMRKAFMDKGALLKVLADDGRFTQPEAQYLATLPYGAAQNLIEARVVADWANANGHDYIVYKGSNGFADEVVTINPEWSLARSIEYRPRQAGDVEVYNPRGTYVADAVDPLADLKVPADKYLGRPIAVDRYQTTADPNEFSRLRGSKFFRGWEGAEPYDAYYKPYLAGKQDSVFAHEGGHIGVAAEVTPTNPLVLAPRSAAEAPVDRVLDPSDMWELDHAPAERQIEIMKAYGIGPDDARHLLRDTHMRRDRIFAEYAKSRGHDFIIQERPDGSVDVIQLYPNAQDSVRIIGSSEGRIESIRRMADEPPQTVEPKLGPEAVQKYTQQQEQVSAAIADEVSAAVAQGSPIPAPDQILALKEQRLKELDAAWHDRVAKVASTEDDVVLHELADRTELTPEQLDKPTGGVGGYIGPELRAFADQRGVDPDVLDLGELNQLRREYRFATDPDAARLELRGGGQRDREGGQSGRSFFASGPKRAPHPMSEVIRYEDNPTEPVIDKLRRVADTWIDQMSDKEDAPVRVLRRAGLKEESTALSQLIGRARGASRIAELPIFKGVYSFDPVTNNVTRTHDSYASIVGGLDGKAELDLNNLLAARHHMELVDRRNRALMGDPAALEADAHLDINERGTELAQQTIADLESRYGAAVDPNTGANRITQLDDIAQKVRDWSVAAVIDQLDSVGYFKPGLKDAVLTNNREYAPFFRLMDDLAEDPQIAGGTNTHPIERISGGLNPERRIAPPLESFVSQSQKVAVWVERQRVKNLLGDFAAAHPDLLGEIKKVASNADGRAKGPGTFTVFRDGVRHHYSAPVEVLEALDRATPKQANYFLQAGIFAARTLRAGATLTPDFAVRNLLRDQASAGTYGVEFKYRPFADFMTGLWAQTPMASKGLRQFVTDWEASGGALSDYISTNRSALQQTADSAAGLVKLPFTGTKVQVGQKVARIAADWRGEQNVFAKVMYPLLKPLEFVSGSVEQATRVGAFRRAKLGGAADLAASDYSRNITLDFGRSGSLAQKWNSVEAFANAGLQDVARFSKAMRDRPVSTTVAGLSTITVPALAAYYANKDDPDYQSLPNWEKAAFVHVKKLDDGRWVRLPRPQGVLNLVFGYGVQQMLEAAEGKLGPEPVNELLATLFHETPLRYLPIQPDAGPSGNVKGSLEFLPSAMQPAAEVAAGEGGWSTFRQSPIVPAGMQEGTLPENRSADTTSATAQWIGRKLDAAPLKVDYLIRSYGAGMTVMGLQAAERMTGVGPHAPGGSIPQLPSTAKDIPGVGGLLSTSPYGFASQPVTDLYQLQQAAANAKGSLTLAAKQGRVFEYQHILREHPEALVADQLTDARRSLKEFRDMRKEILQTPGLTPEQRMDRLLAIDQAVTQLAAGHMHMASDVLRGYRKALDTQNKRVKP